MHTHTNNVGFFFKVVLFVCVCVCVCVCEAHAIGYIWKKVKGQFLESILLSSYGFRGSN